VTAERFVRNKVIMVETMKIFRVEETLKTEAAYYSEITINIHQNTWRHIPED
jgi:hypothetical protein